MKRWSKPVYAGIQPELNKETNKYEFKIDFEANSEKDVIQFIEPYYFESKKDNDVYWFGYKFNDGVDSKLRKDFIEFMKDVKFEQWVDPEDEFSDFYFEEGGITEPDLRRMIVQSVDRIGLSNYDIDLIVCPQSSGKLVSAMRDCLVRYLSIGREVSYAELHKADPSAIKFNIDKCLSDIEDNRFKFPDYVNRDYLENIQKKIKNADRFSMRKLVYPPILRRYVSGIFRTPHTKPLETAESILIIDDFKTFGTTINEMIETIRTYNSDNTIYVFTLFGKIGKL